MGKNKVKVKGNKSFLKSGYINTATYDDYMMKLKKIATSIFEWDNLPDSMDSDYLEECLYLYGQAGLLYDKDKGGFINTRTVGNNRINIYGIPISLNCFSFSYNKNYKTYMNEDIQDEENYKDTYAILVRNNYERIPTITQMELFAWRLTNAERSADVNISLQKFPLFVLCNENQKFTMIQMLEQYEGNVPFIMGDKDSMNLENIKSLNTDIPFIADKLEAYKEKIWNEALMYLGVNGIIYEKKERLIEAEAESNNEAINYNLMSFLKWRQRACDEFNKLYQLSDDKKISVKIRSDLKNIIKNVISTTNDYITKENKELIEGEING